MKTVDQIKIYLFPSLIGLLGFLLLQRLTSLESKIDKLTELVNTDHVDISVLKNKYTYTTEKIKPYFFTELTYLNDEKFTDSIKYTNTRNIM